uniref:Putative secreted protein n=1 Tax=Rhipicephalus microplus TaxID=6941 RepID=A0A6M2DB40_RHIMP
MFNFTTACVILLPLRKAASLIKEKCEQLGSTYHDCKFSLSLPCTLSHCLCVGVSVLLSGTHLCNDSLIFVGFISYNNELCPRLSCGRNGHSRGLGLK